MSKLRIFYIASLVILGVLLVFTVFAPIAEGEKYSEVQRVQLLQAEDEWIIQFDIMNREGEDKSYTITVEIDGKQYSQRVLIGDDKSFTYIHHIYRERVTEGCATFTICKEGEAIPIEQATFYLK